MSLGTGEVYNRYKRKKKEREKKRGTKAKNELTETTYIIKKNNREFGNEDHTPAGFSVPVAGVSIGRGEGQTGKRRVPSMDERKLMGKEKKFSR